MATFGDLKDEVLERAGVKSHFDLFVISPAFKDFWEKLNRMEYDRGYVPGEYEKPGSPALCEMDLLTDEEFAKLLKELNRIMAG